MKVKFRIEYSFTTELLKKISDVMNRMDLGISSIERRESEIASWNTTAKVDNKYIKKMSKKLKEYYEKIGAFDVKVTKI